MVGLIQRILLEMIEHQAGQAGLTRVITRVGIPADREFRLDTNYCDVEFQQLYQATMEELGVDQEGLEILYARHFLNDAQKRWPMWFSMSKNAREFLLRQPKIHNGIASAMSNEEDRSRMKDKFHFEEHPQHIVIHYRSEHKLCGLFKNLVNEVLKLYQERASITESCCLKHGDAECCISVSWD